MRITYDREADAVYISFRETPVTTKHRADGVALDYDTDGRLAGIEILDASVRVSDANASLTQLIFERAERARPPS